MLSILPHYLGKLEVQICFKNSTNRYNLKSHSFTSVGDKNETFYVTTAEWILTLFHQLLKRS